MVYSDVKEDKKEACCLDEHKVICEAQAHVFAMFRSRVVRLCAFTPIDQWKGHACTLRRKHAFDGVDRLKFAF